MPKQAGLAPILIVLIIAAIGLGGFFIYNSLSLRGSASGGDLPRGKAGAAISPTPSSKESSSSADMTNWKTYIGKNYSFKYPRDWSLKKEIDTPAFEDVFYLISTNDQTVISGSVYLLKTNGITKEQIISNDKEFIDDVKQENINLPIGSAIRMWGVTNSKNRDDKVGRYWSVVYVKNNVRLFRIWLDSPSQAQDTEIFDQILSTFKFTP